MYDSIKKSYLGEVKENMMWDIQQIGQMHNKGVKLAVNSV